MQTSFFKLRGFHYWLCVKCGAEGRELIPDQADDRYSYNKGNPWLGLCGRCGVPTATIQVGNHTVKTQPLPEGTELPPELDAKWAIYLEVASRYQRKARYEDRADLCHTILIRLCEVDRAREAQGEPLTELGRYRVASIVVMQFWHTLKRNGKVISLDTKVDEADDFSPTLADTVPDDRAIDLVEWLDARVWLLGCPERLVQIAMLKVNGKALSQADHKYLQRYRAKAQMSLSQMSNSDPSN